MYANKLHQCFAVSFPIRGKTYGFSTGIDHRFLATKAFFTKFV